MDYHWTIGEFLKMKVPRLLFAIISLTAIWIIMRESFSFLDVVLGVAASLACIFFARRFLPTDEVDEVKLSRLFLYPVWLLGQIYLSGFFVIRMILFGARADFIHIDTKLKSNILRVMLGNSITLVPGSITLDHNDDKFIVVVMRDKNASNPKGDMGEQVKGKLEAKLIKAED